MSWGMRGGWRDGAEVLGVRSEFDEMKNGKKDRKVAKAAKGKLGSGACAGVGGTDRRCWVARSEFGERQRSKTAESKKDRKVAKAPKGKLGMGRARVLEVRAVVLVGAVGNSGG